MSFRILGTGMSVPERIVKNDELANYVETNDEWIKQRVGIAERRVATTETCADMAEKAAKAALENAGVKPEELDLIIASTVSGDYASPSLSCLVQKRIGATCMAFDISAACSAFMFLLETAAGYFARGHKKVLLVSSEKLSKLVDWSDRSTCVIFGDGAGAAVLGEGDSYFDSVFNVTGDDEVIRIPTYAGNSPFSALEPEKPVIHMAGQETFKYAVNAIVHDIKTLLERNSISPDEVKYVVPHQANKRIIDAASRRLGIPYEKFVVDIDKYGNTSSASLPIALDELWRSGELKRGDLVVFTAFGGGLADAACLIRW
ncbi:MAG: ketoacyl-ACP synthase III [Clostridiales bacterium]|nr:ketoacyl-ACP synthase III [Clostridiales bacterium]MDY4434677.1 beta-ketoacyl-ACP synthase III [Candidatus Flemingibacterium sp.]